MQKREYEDEIIVDDASGEEIALEDTEAGAHELAGKLKALRKELTAAQKESADNLAGWQRAKADLINYRRTVLADRERDDARAKGNVIRSFIPVLDSFDSAMADSSWATVDEVWRSGMERVAGQLRAALESSGCEPFGTAGEPFDPAKHECLSVTPVEQKEKEDTVAHVIQKGYRIADEVIRPAKVVVAQYSDPPPSSP